MKMDSLFQASLSALKNGGITNLPLAELRAHHRNMALGFSKVFSRFALEVCGCEEPGDRVKLRKSVWLQTAGLKLSQFKTGSSSNLETVAKAECPVQILSKKSVASREETSPSKIILASKLLRSHLSISEATVCRGCSKRGRCPFARKVVTNKTRKTSLGALGKVLYGISQSCRLHLKDPELYPLVVSGEEMEAAVELVEQLTHHLEPSAMERQLKNVPVAEKKAVKAIVLRKLKNKQVRDRKKKLMRKSGMPAWMASELINIEPTAEKKREGKIKKGHDKFDLDSDEWVPEEKQEELLKPNLLFKEEVVTPNSKMKKKNHLVPLDNLADLPIPQRFPERTRKPVKVSRKKEGEVRQKIDINERQEGDVKDIKISPDRGYVVGNGMIAGGGIEYIKPQFLKGKTVLDNVKMARKVWEGNLDEKLKFIKRVPFDASSPRGNNRAIDPLLAKVLQKKTPPAKIIHDGLTPAAKIIHDGLTPPAKIIQEGLVCSGSSGGLKFPKLPQWEPASIAHNSSKSIKKVNTEKIISSRSGQVTERSKIEYRSLLRPEKEQKRSAAALEKRRGLSLKTTTDDISGLWK